MLLAKPGVYAVKVFIYKKVKNLLKVLLILGYRPTFNQKKILLRGKSFIQLLVEIFIIRNYISRIYKIYKR